MPKITKRAVDALKPHERERVVWDEDLKGFGVRVHPSGRKVFIVKTRYRRPDHQDDHRTSRRRQPYLCPCTGRRDHHRRQSRQKPGGAQVRRADHARPGEAVP